MCLTVRGLSVPQRLHDRGKKREREEVRVCEAREIDFMASVRLVRRCPYRLLLNYGRIIASKLNPSTVVMEKKGSCCRSVYTT